MSAPALSVVLTVYNMGDCLAPCLDDLLAQTFDDFELICIDDGSTDGSADTLQRYAPRFGSMRLVRQANSGPAAARNAGIRLAQGECLMLLDSDDRFEPTLLERMVGRLRETRADVAVCRADEFDHATGKRRPTEWTVRAELLPEGAERGPFRAQEAMGCPFSAFMGWPWDKAYRTRFVREEGLLFPEDLPNAEDFPFVYLALCKAAGIAVVDEALIHHRVKRAGSTSNSRLAAPFSFYEGIERLKRRLEGDAEQWGALRWGFSNWALNYACWNIESLPAGSPQRSQLIEALLGGGMPALELGEHPLSYFALHPDVEWCLQRFEKERATGKAQRKSAWEYLSVGCKRLGSKGLLTLAKQVAAMVRDR